MRSPVPVLGILSFTHANRKYHRNLVAYSFWHHYPNYRISVYRRPMPQKNKRQNKHTESWTSILPHFVVDTAKKGRKSRNYRRNNYLFLQTQMINVYTISTVVAMETTAGTRVTGM